MALGKRWRVLKSKLLDNVNGDEERLGFGIVKYTRGMGRKRIVMSNEIEESPERTPLKRQCSERFELDGCVKSPLEDLPQDILIRILCGVDHEDLEQLCHVSNAIRKASFIAKQCHFEYTTPKKTRAFRNTIDLDNDSSNLEDMEPPNAPRFHRGSKIRKKNLADITVSLFS